METALQILLNLTRVSSLYACMHVCCMYVPYIKTHGSESRGQEEAGLRDKPVSYLQVAPL